MIEEAQNGLNLSEEDTADSWAVLDKVRWLRWEMVVDDEMVESRCWLRWLVRW